MEVTSILRCFSTRVGAKGGLRGTLQSIGPLLLPIHITNLQLKEVLNLNFRPFSFELNKK